MVKVVDLFTDELTLADLKVCHFLFATPCHTLATPQGRRAIAVRVIDQRRGGTSVLGHFYERKVALLAKEDQIEAEFEKMVPPVLDGWSVFLTPVFDVG